jgi:three-Cys-motif partner protein
MTAPTTVLWPINAHTSAKHEILRRYLDAWLPIMSRHNGQLIYLDGFAGPGEYIGGESGSPLIAIETFLSHGFTSVRSKDVHFLFIEQDPNRCRHLEQLLTLRSSPGTVQYQVFEGNFDETMTDLLNQLERTQTRLAPTFAFIDPFGYSHTPMKTLQRLMSHPRCEVLITFMYEEINRFLTAGYTGKESQYNTLFGTSAWQTIADTVMDTHDRKTRLHDLYQEQLKTQAKARYVRSFCMKNRHNATDYYLFFATNNLLGMKKMKEAMARVDPTGAFIFSDFTNSNQMLLFSEPNYSELERLLSAHFRGKIASIEDIEEFVIADTPFWIYKREVLKAMEATSKIQVISDDPQRKRGTYVEGKTRIHFL